ncbi:uncharacterized protein N7482_010633 [Penicillium canariense]|uniref:Integrase zinc-binding domain-containing protein n=1 Tax=Penicillium canariense TaxID=189055 RepID=A0A9W9HN23_9EURO|nr:uncharacterized protein N7482_010633 [Penicillium canariense]KAJ5151381.1 hypothetical protein N7482_010633 [Penicillium canariense]
MERDILEEYHNAQNHLGFHRVYYQIRASYYTRGLAKRLTQYIFHCLKCLSHQTSLEQERRLGIL